LDIELAESEHAVTESTTTVSEAMDAEAFATDATAQARTNLVTAAALRDRHTEVRNRFERVQANQQTTQKQQQQRDQEITRLERARIERDRLVPIAGRLADLNRDVLTAEGERNRSRRKTELERERSGQATTRTETVNKLASEVQSLASENADPQWTWSDADASAVPIAIERLKQVATAHPVNHAEHRHTSLIAARAASEQATLARTNLDKYLTAQNGLLAEQKAVLSDGDPTSMLATIAESSTQIRQAMTAWETERKSLELDLGKRTRVLTNIRNSNFDDGCPTCGRKFSEHDEHDVLELFAADIDSIHTRIREGDQRGQELGIQRKALEQEREKQTERQLLQKKIEDRLARSVGFIEEQRLTVANLDTQAATSLEAARVDAVPTENDIKTAARKLGLARLLRETMSRIRIYASTIASLDIARQQLDTDLTLLDDVAFDEHEFASLVSSRDAATTAATQIDGFDRELLQLPIAIEDREKLAASMSGIEKQIADIKQELFDVGFDPELLQVAERNVTDAEQTERAALRAHQQAQLNHQKVVSARQSIEREHNRIRSIVLRADSRQRESDELTQMYNLFGEFEQFVVSRLTPALSEMTSDLVRQVTDGKYDDVSFDDNFGVLVRDGDELPFPLATFSGGERDAIALCARLALSQMIGLQAAEQPGFLVLDEVFGSLDRDRRSRLLELFGNLSAISEGFQQVFIISHVDDVRTAPIFDELWMIEEGEDGKSSLSNLAPGTDIGEL
ncbi:MAG: SbcC/MukB-like Walker B domain-containing protein, partial [Thermomicrobiales bacterium]